MKKEEIQVKRRFFQGLAPGEDLLTQLQDFAKKKKMKSALFTAIGAVHGAEVAFYDQEEKLYSPITFTEEMELLSCTGNIASFKDEVIVHAHVVLGRADGSTVGGHLNSAKVFAGEAYILELKEEITRSFDEKTGLNLLDL